MTLYFKDTYSHYWKDSTAHEWYEPDGVIHEDTADVIHMDTADVVHEDYLDGQAIQLPIIQPDPATFSIAGQTVNLLHIKKLSPSAATFPIVGQSVGLTHFTGYFLSPTVASFAIHGQTVGLRHNKKLAGSAATFPISGQTVNFVYTPILRISPDPAAFGVAGQSVRLLFNRRLDPNKDIFPIAGQNVTLTFGETPHKSKALFYFFTLTGDRDGVADVEIPISSFQARLRSGDPTYLSVIIPGVDQAAAISARPNGLMRVDVAYKSRGVWSQRTPIIEAWLEDIRLDKGPISKSVTLTGHRQKTYTNKAITLTGATYQNTINGEMRYRLAEPDPSLYPGDTVTVDTDTFAANVIYYYVNARRGGVETMMEVSES